ncbi:UNVERIFIED_CONTAM: hypothetical protein Scaly_3036800 [Sesamum calycinum]|uniref:Retrotransposon Copia-like N-terminal domain-containing protein n=1 Tax=Sesamum calycinum TaxID=2727403 RepID=A0AAW2K786_9LAMI
MAPANITANFNTIPMLNGSNFKLWKENLEIVLGVMDLDLVLSEDSLPALIDKSISEQKREKESVQEEERLKQDKTECAYFASTSKGKDKGKKGKRIIKLQI